MMMVVASLFVVGKSEVVEVEFACFGRYMYGIINFMLVFVASALFARTFEVVEKNSRWKRRHR